MSRKIKVVGLALVAVLAMSAVAASAANAEPKFTASSYPATATGGQTTKHVFTVQGQEVTCNKATFTSTLSAESSKVEATPVYEECKAFGFINAKVEMNGCTYAFTVEVTTTGKPLDEFDGSVHITCPTGKEITVVASTCTVHIPAQTPTANHVHYHVETGLPNKILVTSLVGGIHAKVTSGFLCPLESAETDTSGEYTGSTLMSAAPTGIDIAME